MPSPLPPLTRADVAHLATSIWPRSSAWWERAAAERFAAGAYELIPNRRDDFIYLPRFWLMQPLRADDDRLESGDATLLHYFAHGDDDECLHDHPWDFHAEVLTGAYEEHLPPLDWDERSSLGPAWNARTVMRRPGSSRLVPADQLHCVGRVEPGTWTIIRTGPRRRRWGFHPEGRLWTDADEFLGLRRPPAPAAAATG